MGERSEYQGVWGGGCVQKGDSIRALVRALVMRVIPIAFFAEAGHGNNDLSAQGSCFSGLAPFLRCVCRPSLRNRQVLQESALRVALCWPALGL